MRLSLITCPICNANWLLSSANTSKFSGTLTPIKVDGKIFKTNLNEIKSVSDSSDDLFKLKKSPENNNLNSSVLTFDNSTLITSDEMNQTKKYLLFLVIPNETNIIKFYYL